jgi:hypothetical protein
VKRSTVLLVCLLCSATVRGQTVTLPEKVLIPNGRLGSVPIVYEGDDVKWTASPELDVFREYDADPKKIRLRVMAHQDGVYYVKAIACKGGKMSEFATCDVVVGVPGPKPPDPGPGPGPKPPDPKPPGPGPGPEPSPFPDPGVRVLVVYETGQEGALPRYVHTKAFANALDNKCALGPDGKTREWRIWDKDVNTSKAPKIWQDAMARPRASVPWLLIGDGKTGYAGPLPKTAEEFDNLLKKVGG